MVRSLTAEGWRALPAACLTALLTFTSWQGFADSAAQAQPVVAHRLFVTNETSDDMTVIDGLTLEVVANVKLGKRPRGIQASPDGKMLFVALSGTPLAPPGKENSDLPSDKSADGIGVVNAATLKLEGVIRGVSDPEQLAVSPDGKLLSIASEDTDFTVVLDVASGRKVAGVKVAADPEGVGVTSKGGRREWITSEGDNVIPVGKKPWGIAIAP